MKRILLINRGSNTDNYGDQAINFTLSTILKRQGCLVESVDYTRVFYKKEDRFASRIANLLEMISIIRKGYHCIIIGGGQLILNNQKFPLSLLSWTLVVKLFSRTPLVLFAVGVDSNFSFIKKMMIKISIVFINEIYVRDNKSKINLKQIFRKDSNVVPDVVMAISKLYDKKPKQKKKHVLLFGITQYNSIRKYDYIKQTQSEYYKHQAKALLNVFNSFTKVNLMYNTKGDYQEAIQFREYLKENHNINVDLCRYKDLYGFIDSIASADLVISGRMHSLIIACSFGISAIPFVRNEKVKTFKDEYFPLKDPEYYFEQVNSELKKILHKYAS